MRPFLLVLVVVLAAAAGLSRAQEPPRHDQYRDDAHAYCWTAASSGSQLAKRQQDPHGHECSCHLLCQTVDDRVVGDTEDGSCELYCTRERCTCHTEQPCEMPK
jgi:hypothetical protein